MATGESTCLRCRNIDLSAHSLRLNNLVTIQLGNVRDWELACQICRAFARLAGFELSAARSGVDTNDDDDDDDDDDDNGDGDDDNGLSHIIYNIEDPPSTQEYCLLAFNTATIFADPPDVKLADWEDPVSFAVIEKEYACSEGSEEVFNCVRGRGWFSLYVESEDRQRFMPEATKALAEVSLIKSWLQYCIANHKQCHPNLLRTMAPIKLINCSTRQVVSRDHDQSFLTLSYVCSEVPDLGYTDGQLVINQPQLIEDAITLTLQLEYYYLWIDRYCINQVDEVEKGSQILQMDQIYARSDLTIIVADSVEGMSGVSSRKPADTLVLGNQIFIITPPTPRYEIENSIWNRRAWTYQESVLSRRRLVALREQFYFKCMGMDCCESLHGCLQEKTRIDATRVGHRWSESEVFINLSTQDDPLAHIYYHLAEYSKRQLSFPTDILQAIEGVLAQMRQIYPDLAEVTGLPIVHRVGSPAGLKERFLTTLCWKTAFRCERREGFASWSWAGWHAALPFIENREPDIVEMHNLDIGIEDLSSKTTSLEQFYGRQAQNFANRHIHGTRLHIEAPYFVVKFLGWSNRGIESVLPYGKARIWVEGAKMIHGRFFPPTHDQNTKRNNEVWNAIVLGRRSAALDASNSNMLVMLITKRVMERFFERIGVLEITPQELEPDLTALLSRQENFTII
ncbi:MAG: hypothetical protein Q9157_006614 [Trypethelium eluteriae]